MSTTTQCPHCGTRFKASQAQLEAYHGMVRCGHCHAAFNAIEQQTADEQSPQLALPMELEEFVPPPAPEIQTQPPAKEVRAAESMTPAPEAQITSYAYVEEQRRRWPFAIGMVVLLPLLLAQVAYSYRVEIAARLPGLKPALLAYCGVLNCTVPLPHNADLMSIESSNLEADPLHVNTIVLTTILRNQATYPQALPDLELTLNDLNDKPVARRTFHPAEYLPAGYDEKAGLAASREINVRINLDVATDLKAAGYRLLLTYPQP